MMTDPRAQANGAGASPKQRRVPITYKHTRQIDLIYGFPNEPNSPKAEKVRVTKNEKTGEVTATIIKDNLAHLNIYSPKSAFDWRISINNERNGRPVYLGLRLIWCSWITARDGDSKYEEKGPDDLSSSTLPNRSHSGYQCTKTNTKDIADNFSPLNGRNHTNWRLNWVISNLWKLKRKMPRREDLQSTRIWCGCLWIMCVCWLGLRKLIRLDILYLYFFSDGVLQNLGFLIMDGSQWIIIFMGCLRIQSSSVAVSWQNTVASMVYFARRVQMELHPAVEQVIAYHRKLATRWEE